MSVTVATVTTVEVVRAQPVWDAMSYLQWAVIVAWGCMAILTPAQLVGVGS